MEHQLYTSIYGALIIHITSFWGREEEKRSLVNLVASVSSQKGWERKLVDGAEGTARPEQILGWVWGLSVCVCVCVCVCAEDLVSLW
jgi:hypothetical protein